MELRLTRFWGRKEEVETEGYKSYSFVVADRGLFMTPPLFERGWGREEAEGGEEGVEEEVEEEEAVVVEVALRGQ